jgi:hypothetical protein
MLEQFENLDVNALAKAALAEAKKYLEDALKRADQDAREVRAFIEDLEAAVVGTSLDNRVIAIAALLAISGKAFERVKDVSRNWTRWLNPFRWSKLDDEITKPVRLIAYSYAKSYPVVFSRYRLEAGL